MKWLFIPWFAAGAAAALFLFRPAAGIEIYPEWWSAMKAIGAIEPSQSAPAGAARFFVKADDRDFWILGGDGRALRSGSIDDGLAAFSGNGAYYIKYRKVGTEIEFFNAAGDRFWKLESLEYPYLSHRGKLVLLMNGDQTGIRMADESGNLIGRPLAGRTCTAIAFSGRTDRAAVGFLDGSYYFINERGVVVRRGRAPGARAVKGVAVSDGGAYGAVHYGGVERDFLRVIDIVSGDHDDVVMARPHTVRTSMHVGDDGHCVVLDGDRVIRVSPSGRLKVSIAVPAMRPGHSTIRCGGGLCAVSYSMQNGAGKLLLFKDDGTIILSREFPSESFLDASLQGPLLLLRGSDGLFCYRINRR